MKPLRSHPSLRFLAGGILLSLAALAPSGVRAQEEGTVLAVSVTSRASGQPVMGAKVQIVGTGIMAVTDASGRLRLAGIPAGLQTVEVRRLGYQTRLSLVTLEPGGSAALSFALDVQPIPVAAITVRAEQKAGFNYLESMGFNRRRRSGIGSFLTRADLVKHEMGYLSDALRSVAGVNLLPMGSGTGGAYAQMGRSGTGRICPIQYFLDGVLVGPGFNIDDVAARDVEGLEVYKGASQIPPEFNRRTAGCGVIAVWTRVK